MRSLQIAVHVLDIAAARRYLADVRALADEAVKSSDVRVIVGALRVLERQPAEIHRRFLQAA
jgi:hypothetical protein